MDPREQIRRFLEQRRELGETEFVLDSLGVDEVLRVLGADSSTGERAIPTLRSRGDEGAPTRGKGDWRAALLSAGGDAGRAAEEPHAGAPPRLNDRAIPPDLRNRPVPAPIISPPSPEPRRADAAGAVAQDAAAAAPQIPLDQIPSGLVVGSPVHDIFASGSPWNSLGEIAQAVAACTRCGLYRQAKNPVPGVGNPNADFVCVGEAPGASEDEQGVPFVGQAGQLLTKILAAINLSRDDVFICNVLKHRPPGNRNPMPDEVTACSPYLVRQIELLRPKVLLALGTFAAQTLLQTKESIGKLRGRIHRYHGVPVVVTYHPAALLRNPSWKRPTWEDVQLARRLLDRAVPGA